MTDTAAPPDTGPSPEQPGFEALAGAVDEALARVTALDDDARGPALALKDAVEAFHRDGLVTIVRTLKNDPAGRELLFGLVDDPHVRALFTLHGIIRADPATRALEALETVRPYLQSHGGDVELVRIEGGIGFVRLHGACSGCSMSAVTLTEMVAEALIEGVEEISAVEVLDDEPTAAFIPLEGLGRIDSGWVRGPFVAELTGDRPHRWEVDGECYILVNHGGRVAAFRNECVHQGRSLDGGMLEDGVLTCPWHGFTFDVGSGECLSAPGAQLEQIPLRIDDARVWVRAN
ncbi:MAG TPA: hypothetical protein ENI86_08425 [Acidimicrobiales bacterium]|nr:hypothetical protein [Acidimicrobiales bacterium]